MLDYFVMLKTRKMRTKKLPRVLVRRFQESSREWNFAEPSMEILFKEIRRNFERMTFKRNLENLR